MGLKSELLAEIFFWVSYNEGTVTNEDLMNNYSPLNFIYEYCARQIDLCLFHSLGPQHGSGREEMMDPSVAVLEASWLEAEMIGPSVAFLVFSWLAGLARFG